MPNNIMNASEGLKFAAKSICDSYRNAAIEAGYEDEDVLLKAWANSTGVTEAFELNLRKKDPTDI